jgi:hypothetical protein
MSAWVRPLFSRKQPEVAADDNSTAMPATEDTAEIGEDQIAAVEQILLWLLLCNRMMRIVQY